jgi:hypothetical protein
VSHVGALDRSHLLLLLDLAHALFFFLHGVISHMVTLFLALEASDESLLWLKLHFGGLRGFAILPKWGTAALRWGTATPWSFCSLERSYCILDIVHFFKFSFDFAIVGLVTF